MAAAFELPIARKTRRIAARFYGYLVAMGAVPPRTDGRSAKAHQGRDSRAEGVAQGGGGVNPSSPVVIKPVAGVPERVG